MNRRDSTVHPQSFDRSAQGMLLGPPDLHSADDILADIEEAVGRRYRKADKHARQGRLARGGEEEFSESAALLTRRRR